MSTVTNSNANKNNSETDSMKSVVFSFPCGRNQPGQNASLFVS